MIRYIEICTQKNSCIVSPIVFMDNTTIHVIQPDSSLCISNIERYNTKELGSGICLFYPYNTYNTWDNSLHRKICVFDAQYNTNITLSYCAISILSILLCLSWLPLTILKYRYTELNRDEIYNRMTDINRVIK